jgi:hypothetical protein
MLHVIAKNLARPDNDLLERVLREMALECTPKRAIHGAGILHTSGAVKGNQHSDSK